MFRNEVKILLAIILLVPAILLSASNLYAESDEKTAVGTLSAQLDSQKGTVTAMFVGYTEGSPVIIGPYSWDISAEDFSKATAEDVGKKLCGQHHSLKKITKSANTGKEIVATVVIEGQKAQTMVGR